MQAPIEVVSECTTRDKQTTVQTCKQNIAYMVINENFSRICLAMTTIGCHCTPLIQTSMHSNKNINNNENSNNNDDKTGCMQVDPEGFIRSLDADTGPDADNPRACGVALLLCMLRKGAGHVAEAMLAYVSHLQVCLQLAPQYEHVLKRQWPWILYIIYVLDFRV